MFHQHFKSGGLTDSLTVNVLDKKTSSEPDVFMVVRAGFEPTTHGFHSTALPTLAGESLRIPELPYHVIVF
jgi:hypothetical protein